METSSQPLMKKHIEKVSNAGRAMQFNSSQPPASTRIEYNRPLFVRAKPKTDSPRISGPTFLRKQPNASLSTDEPEQLDSTPKSSQTLASGPSVIDDKPFSKAPQPHPDSASSQQPARGPISNHNQALNDGVTTVSASQCKPLCPFLVHFGIAK